MKVEAIIRVNNFPAIRAAFPRVLSDIMSKATHDVYAQSQVTVPVRKDQRRVRGGTLKNSGQVRFSGFEGEVSYSTDYVIYVHEGTRYMPARPFLTNAAESVMPSLNAALGSLESRLPG